MLTFSEFYDKVANLQEHQEHRELEEYLRALYPLVSAHQKEEPSLQLFLQLFETAFHSAPLSFDSHWLHINSAPDARIMSHKFTNPGIRHFFDQTAATNHEGVNYTFAVLEFQISELYKMRNKQLKNKMKYFGVDSETGNRWYNFDPFTNLECGARCIADSLDDEDVELPVTWATMGEILEYGRIYE